MKYAQTLSTVLHRGAQAAARGAVPCASQVLDRGADAVARGAVPCASQILDRGAKAGTQAFTCGDAALPQQENKTRQMRKKTE